MLSWCKGQNAFFFFFGATDKCYQPALTKGGNVTKKLHFSYILSTSPCWFSSKSGICISNSPHSAFPLVWAPHMWWHVHQQLQVLLPCFLSPAERELSP